MPQRQPHAVNLHGARRHGRLPQTLVLWRLRFPEGTWGSCKSSDKDRVTNGEKQAKAKGRRTRRKSGFGGGVATKSCPAEELAEKRFNAVILSGAKNLALRIFMAMRDSSSPAAPQNDSAHEFFRNL
jgi:hypothetical protein